VDEGVTVDGAATRPGDRVAEGAIITTPPPAPVAGLEAEDVEFTTVYEDEWVLVVDKPAGVTVHPGSGRSRGTLAAGLLRRFPELEGVGEPGRWGLIHRLDRETSGVLIVARTPDAFLRLTADMAARRIHRRYLALAHNRFPVPTGTIDAPIGRDPSQPTRRAVVATGKPSVSHYEVIEELANGEVSLLEVRLDTGRTHQIRVHLAAIDHPVLGDRTYAGALFRLTAPRVMLHARFVGFEHPGTEVAISVEAPMPEDMVEVIEGLRGSAS
jgi:23S rRNA pseudouridine1911/1915/1917 synthase